MSLQKRRASVLGLAILTGVSIIRVSAVAASAGPNGRAARQQDPAAAAGPTPDPTPQAAPAAPRAPATQSGTVATADAVRAGVWVLRIPRGHSPAVFGLLFRSGTLAGSTGRPVEVRVGGRSQMVVTNAGTVGQLVRAMGIRLGGDVLRPAGRTPLAGVRRVHVLKVTRRREVVSVTIPFGTLVRYTGNLAAGQTEVNRSGSDGEGRETILATYRNGRLISRKIVATQVIVAPVDEIVLRGAAKNPPTSRTGVASWYACSGDHAASPWLPFGTVVTVTDLDTGRTVTVVINDRGPYGAGRILDLCSPAFAAIAPLSQGVATVRIAW